MKDIKRKIIAIIGLMGVGKTTLGKHLAQNLQYYFLDCDSEIEDRERQSINEIFAKNGEKYFRQLEEKVIAEIANRDENIVLSLGGGAFMSENTQKILQEKAIIIWLEAPIDEIIKRIGKKNNRPLLQNKDKRKILEELAQKRYPQYSKAHLKFDTSKNNGEILVKEIIQKINQLQNAR